MAKAISTKRSAELRNKARQKKTNRQVEKKAAAIADYSVLVKPITTEKTTLLGAGDKGGIAFEVDKRASKFDIKSAVERVFKVEVSKVRTLTTKGKVKRTTKAVGRRKSIKKAYVTLKPGNVIELLEGV